MTTTPLPSHETVAGALRNALMIAELGAHGNYKEGPQTFGDITRLIRIALVELSEPNLAAMQAGEILLKEWDGTPDERRQLRDTVQGILRGQLEGIVPKTWEER